MGVLLKESSNINQKRPPEDLVSDDPCASVARRVCSYEEVGFHVLEMLNATTATKAIPVIIFTNLDQTTKDNVERSKALGALDYWVKAHWQPSQVVEMVKKIVLKSKK